MKNYKNMSLYNFSWVHVISLVFSLSNVALAQTSNSTLHHELKPTIQTSAFITLTSMSQLENVCPHKRFTTDKFNCVNNAPKVRSCKLSFSIKNLLKKPLEGNSFSAVVWDKNGNRIYGIKRPEHLFTHYEIKSGEVINSDESDTGKNATYGYVDNIDCNDIREIKLLPNFIGAFMIKSEIAGARQIQLNSQIPNIGLSFDVNAFNSLVKSIEAIKYSEKEKVLIQASKEHEHKAFYEKKGLPKPSFEQITKCAGYLYGFTKLNTAFTGSIERLLEEANDFLDLAGGLHDSDKLASKAIEIGDNLSQGYVESGEFRNIDNAYYVMNVKNMINIECANFGEKYGIETVKVRE